VSVNGRATIGVKANSTANKH